MQSPDTSHHTRRHLTRHGHTSVSWSCRRAAGRRTTCKVKLRKNVRTITRVASISATARAHEQQRSSLSSASPMASPSAYTLQPHGTSQYINHSTKSLSRAEAAQIRSPAPSSDRTSRHAQCQKPLRESSRRSTSRMGTRQRRPHQMRSSAKTTAAPANEATARPLRAASRSPRDSLNGDERVLAHKRLRALRERLQIVQALLLQLLAPLRRVGDR